MAAPETPGEHDPFAVLGVPRGCSPETLHRAYRTLARRYHPDVNADAAAAADMRRINAAFVAARRELRAHAVAPALPTPTPPAAAAPTPASNPPAATATSASPGTPTPTSGRPVGGASSFPPRYARLASQAARARIILARVAARPLWGLGVLVAASGALVLLLVLARAGWIGISNAAPPGGVPALAMGQSTTATWPGVGHVRLREHAIATLPAGSYQNPSWSYDDHYVAVSANDAPGHTGHPSILVLDASGHEVRSLPGFAARWSPRADDLAILALPQGATVPELDLADIAAGTERTLVAQAGNHLAWSPDGSQIAFSAQSQRVIRLLDPRTGQMSLLYTPLAGEPGTHVLPLGWYDAGDVLCVETAGTSTQLVLLQLASGALAPLPPALTGINQEVAWNPASGQVLYTAPPSGQTSGATFLLDRASGATHTIPGRRNAGLLAGWSANSAWLGAAANPSGAGDSTLCLVALSANVSPSAWPGRCLALGERVDGLRWENQAAQLSYLVRTGTSEQLRELAISVVGAPGAAAHSWLPVRPLTAGLPLLLVGMLAALRGGRRGGAGEDAAAHASAQATRRLRLGVVSEALKWPPDEALKRTALELVLALQRHGEVLAIGTQGKRHPDDRYPALCLRINRAYVSWPLWRRLWTFQPDILFYLPGSGLTFFSLARAAVLRLACLARLRRPLLVLVSIQPHALGRMERWLLRALGPVRLVVQSPRRGAELARQGFATHVLAGGVDAGRFCPVGAARREALRRQHGIASGVAVILHVGHLKRDRHVDALVELKRRMPEAQVVLVASTSTVSDLALKTELRRAGVSVLDDYLPHVEELYQIADCYVFPVQDAHHCAEFPLSVLEALACGVPTVTTRFGALPASLPPGAGIQFVDTAEQLYAAVAATLEAGRAGSTKPSRGWTVSAYAWECQVDQLMAALRPRAGVAPATQVCTEHEGVVYTEPNAMTTK